MEEMRIAMRKILPALLLFAGFGIHLPAQVTSECLERFYDEAETLIHSAERKTGNEIVLDIHAYVSPDFQKGFKEKVSYIFMNDSVFCQSFGRKNEYYLVFRGSQVVDYDYKAQKANETYRHPNQTERDSAGYALKYWERYCNSPNWDTVKCFYRATKDSVVKSQEMLNISTKGPPSFSRNLYYDDTLRIYRNYIFRDSLWVRRHELVHRIERASPGFIVETTTSTWYDDHGKETQRETSREEKRYYYDEKNRLSRVEIFICYNGSDDPAERSVMKIGYYRRL